MLAEGVFSPKTLSLAIDSKSTFRGLPEVELQQKAPIWKAERLSFSISKELTPEDIAIKSYEQIESPKAYPAEGEVSPKAYFRRRRIPPKA